MQLRDFLKKYDPSVGFTQTSVNMSFHSLYIRCLLAGRMIANTAASCSIFLGSNLDTILNGYLGEKGSQQFLGLLTYSSLVLQSLIQQVLVQI